MVKSLAAHSVGTSGQEGNVSQYRTALEDAERSIQRRAAWYRNQVVSVVAVAVAVVVSALAARSPLVLGGFLLLIPLSGAFLVADVRLFTRWRSRFLDDWSAKKTDIVAFAAAIRAHPKLPPNTVEGMLATLPSTGDLVAEQAIEAPTRRAIAASAAARQQDRADALLFKVVASGIVVPLALASVWARSWVPLTGLAALLALPIVRVWRASRRRAVCEATVRACREQPGFDEVAYTRVRAAST
jgi:hypothetical protein